MTRKWLPLAPPGVPSWRYVTGFIPTPSGTYRTNDAWTAHATGPVATATRAWCALLPGDVSVGYLGTTNKLYVWDGGSTFTDRSKGGGTYTTTSRPWSFAQFGDITLATNRADTLQFRDATTTNNFADVAGASATATVILTQSDQVLMFDLNDGGVQKRDAFVTCAPGDYTDWTSANATTATRIRHRPGRITAATAFRDYVLVFKANSVYKLTYTGNATYKWRVECIAVGCGADYTFDVVNCGDCVLFTGKDGFWKFDGSTFTRIDRGFYKGVYTFASHVYCPVSRNVWWMQSTEGNCYVYNLDSDSWGSAITFASGLGGNYVQLMGDPAALGTFQGVYAPSYSGKPDLHFMVAASGGTCFVYRNNLAWGGASSGLTASISGHMEGIGGFDAMGREILTNFQRLNVEYADTFGAALTPAGTTALTLNGYGYNREEWADTSGQTMTPATSSTNARHFDISIASRYMRFALNVPDNTGHVEIADWKPAMSPAGAGVTS